MKTNFGHLHLFTFCSADQFCSRLKAGILNSMMKLYGEKVVTIIFNHIMVKDGLTKLMKPPKPKGNSSAKIWLQKSAKIFLTNLTEEFCFHVLYLDRSPAFLTF